MEIDLVLVFQTSPRERKARSGRMIMMTRTRRIMVTRLEGRDSQSKLFFFFYSKICCDFLVPFTS